MMMMMSFNVIRSQDVPQGQAMKVSSVMWQKSHCKANKKKWNIWADRRQEWSIQREVTGTSIQEEPFLQNQIYFFLVFLFMLLNKSGAKSFMLSAWKIICLERKKTRVGGGGRKRLTS